MMHRRRMLVLVPLLTAFLGTASARAAVPGSLDSSFGGGVVNLASGTQLFGVGVESNGEVIAAGQTGGHVLVQCFNASGGSAGQYVGGGGSAQAVAIQADGQAVVAGSSGGLFVQRFNPNCTADTSFHGGTPAVASALGGGAAANGVAVGSDGKIVAAGSVPHDDAICGGSTRPAVARFTSTGGIDSGFGSGGTVVPDHGHPCALATAVAVQGDGKIVLTGRWEFQQFPVTSSWVERLTAGGSDDGTFGSGGIYEYSSHGAGYATMNAVTIQHDGKIVVAGADTAPPPGVNQGPSAVFVRLSANGTPDASFGSAGIEQLSSGTFTPDPYGANGVGIAGGGRIVGAGAVIENGSHDAGIWAVTPGGGPDTEGAFIASATVLQPGGVEACGMAVAPDGSLVIVGDTVSPSRQGVPCQVTSGVSAFAARYVGFGPPPVATPPGVTTGAATSVGEVSATVTGSVNPNGIQTDYHFDYGTTMSYGSSTPSQSAGSGTTPQNVSAQLTGLTPSTTYHYRIVATNVDGPTTGFDETFTTAAAKPASASTGTATRVGEVSATVHGSVDTGGLDSTYHFEYGKSSTYGSMSRTVHLAAASSALNVAAFLKALKPGTTYHYRIVASNSAGTSRGADRTFKTAPRVSVTLKGLKSSYSVGKLGKGGLRFRVGCSQACTIKELIVIPAATAKRLHLGKHQIVLGSATVKFTRGGKRTVHLKLTNQGKQLIDQLHQVLVTIRITAKPINGGPSRTASATLTLTR